MLIIRWALVPILALGGSFATVMTGVLVASFVLEGVSQTVLIFLSSCIGIAVSIILSAFVAPSNKLLVATISCLLCCVYSGLYGGSEIIRGNPMINVVSASSWILSSIAGWYFIFRRYSNSTTVNCPNCHAPLKGDRRFCTSCGYAVEAVSPQHIGETIKLAGRWVLVPIMAIVSYLIVIFMVHIASFYIPSSSDLATGALVLPMELLGGVLIILVAAGVAPKNKLRVATVLCLLDCGLGIAWLFTDFFTLLQSCFGISGSIIGWYFVYKRRADSIVVGAMSPIVAVVVPSMVAAFFATMLVVLIVLSQINVFLLILGMVTFPFTWVLAIPIVWIATGSNPLLLTLLQVIALGPLVWLFNSKS